jgi:hypothetical protein
MVNFILDFRFTILDLGDAGWWKRQSKVKKSKIKMIYEYFKY